MLPSRPEWPFFEDGRDKPKLCSDQGWNRFIEFLRTWPGALLGICLVMVSPPALVAAHVYKEADLELPVPVPFVDSAEKDKPDEPEPEPEAENQPPADPEAETPPVPAPDDIEPCEPRTSANAHGKLVVPPSAQLGSPDQDGIVVISPPADEQILEVAPAPVDPDPLVVEQPPEPEGVLPQAPQPSAEPLQGGEPVAPTPPPIAPQQSDAEQLQPTAAPELQPASGGEQLVTQPRRRESQPAHKRPRARTPQH